MNIHDRRGIRISRAAGPRTLPCIASIRRSPIARPMCTLCGRLATYRYYNMDQVVAQSLALYGRLTQRAREPIAQSA